MNDNNKKALSIGKHDEFCLATVDEESGTVKWRIDDFKAFSSAVKQIHESKLVAVVSAIGSRGSETKHVLNSLIEEETSMKRNSDKNAGDKTSSSQTSDRDGLQAMILRGSKKYKVPSRVSVGHERVGLVFLNVVYSGKHLNLYEELARFCFAVSSAVVFIRGPLDSEKTLSDMQQLIDSHAKSDAKENLQLITLVSLYPSVEDGVEEYENHTEFIAFLGRDGNYLSGAKMRKLVDVMDVTVIPLNIVLTRDLIELYSDDNNTIAKLKDVFARSFARLDATRMATTTTLIDVIQKALNIADPKTESPTPISTSSYENNAKGEEVGQTADAATKVQELGDCHDLKTTLEGVGISPRSAAESKSSDEDKRCISAERTVDSDEQKVSQENTLAGKQMENVSPETTTAAESSSDISSETGTNEEEIRDTARRVADSRSPYTANKGEDRAQQNLLVSDKVQPSNVKCDNTDQACQKSSPGETVTEEKPNENAAGEASESNQNEEKPVSAYAASEPSVTLNQEPECEEQLVQSTHQVSKADALIDNQISVGDMEMAQPVKDENRPIEKQARDVNQMPTETTSNYDSAMKRASFDNSPDSVARLTSNTFDNIGPDKKKSTIFPDHETPGASSKAPHLIKAQIFERIRPNELNNVVYIHLQQDFLRLIALFKLFTSNPECMEHTFTQETRNWIEAYKTKVKTQQQEHMFHAMTSDLENSFNCFHAYYKNMRDTFDDSPFGYWQCVQRYANDHESGTPKFQSPFSDMLNYVLISGLNGLLEDQERRNVQAQEMESLIARRAREQCFESFENVMNDALAKGSYTDSTFTEIFHSVANQFLQLFDIGEFAQSPAFKNERKSLERSIKATFEEKSLSNERKCYRIRKEAILKLKQALKSAEKARHGHDSTSLNPDRCGVDGDNEKRMTKASSKSADVNSFKSTRQEQLETEGSSKPTSQTLPAPDNVPKYPSDSREELEAALRKLETLLPDASAPMVKAAKVKVEEARRVLSNPNHSSADFKHCEQALQLYIAKIKEKSTAVSKNA